MNRIKVQPPEIPEDGFFTNWAANIIAGGDDDELFQLFTGKERV